MPKNTDLSSILVIGAGPIVIGQACEFDYSGTQACKALREEGYRVILVNSNPATIMTDPDVADATYIEPITVEFVEKIIAKERPDAILATVGGQTALNCAIGLAEHGVLDRYNVKLIGAKIPSIKKAEDRQLFKEAMAKIGLECPRNVVVSSVEQALESLDYVGLPAIIRPSFTLGGAGGGIAYTKEEYINIVSYGLDTSPTHEVLIDESVIGWKEFELEVIRDQADNCIIVCSIENIDPMGVHTGDSITVAPALTLTDKEYQIMRNAAVSILREIGVDTGGSNVQFALDPKTGRMLIVEMNPRVSRSSALASKATGFPIAKVAAKLAVGYTLNEVLNDCTKTTPASFEPTIDYIVTKIPRFTFEKFVGTKVELSSSMKSVGEVMAIGRCFAESLQKALRSMEAGTSGLKEMITKFVTKEQLIEQLKILSPERLFLIAEALRKGFSLEELHQITSYDPWFLEQLKIIIDTEDKVRKQGIPQTKAEWLHLKKLGFSDLRIAELTGSKAPEIRRLRHLAGVRPVYKQIDTCAAEFNSVTSYMYSCYEGNEFNPGECEANVSDKQKVIILGSGPNRIGQGIEFDYACVHAVYALKEAGYETIMINCNPETVSTDYDTADRLYFEPITVEDVIEIVHKEQQKGNLLGVLVQFGGQTPLKIANLLLQEGVKILGTSVDTIDLAEDRDRFHQLLNKLKIAQPDGALCYNEIEIYSKAENIGYPILARPSYVLGGRAMEIIFDKKSLEEYVHKNRNFFDNGPILIDSFLNDAIEVDVDAICDGQSVYVAGIMQHIQEAGVHSGDSACVLPPYSLNDDLIQQVYNQTKAIALALNVIGIINIQFAIQDNKIYVLEANPRSSRTVPFVAKTTGIPVAKIAAQVMLGKTLKDFNLHEQTRYSFTGDHVAVKEAVFPFARFPGVDIILGPEMKSTGEAMGIADNFEDAFAKSQIASGTGLPFSGTVFLSVRDSDKKHAPGLAKDLLALGFKIFSTKGTTKFLKEAGVNNIEVVNKVLEGEPHIVDMIKNNLINLIINTTEGKQSIVDSYSIRRTALMNKITCITTVSGAQALVRSIQKVRNISELSVRSLQEYKFK